MKEEKKVRNIPFCVSFSLMLVCLFAGWQGCSPREAQTNRYNAIGPFRQGLAPVRVGDMWGFIDTNGKIVVPIENDHLRNSVGDYAMTQKSGLWQLVSNDGTRTSLLTYRFVSIDGFSEGLAAAVTSPGGKAGYIDSSGNFVISRQFEVADTFNLGLAPVKKNNKWSYIKTDGTIAITTDFYRAFPFSAEGLALVRRVKFGNLGFIGTDGQIKIPARFKEAHPFSEGLAAVRENDRWGFIDTDGNYKIAAKYYWAEPFSGGMAAVMETDGYKYIDSSGKVVIPGPYKMALPFGDGLGVVTDSIRSYVIDEKGKDTGIAYAEQGASFVGQSATTDGGINTIQAQNVAGFAQFLIVNDTNYQWNMAPSNIAGSVQFADQDIIPVQFIPGVPSIVKPANDPVTGGQSSFLIQFFQFFNSGTDKKPMSGFTQPLFDLTLSGTDPSTKVVTDLKLVFTNTVVAPKPVVGHPWWKVVRNTVGLVTSMTQIALGNPWGYWKFVHSTGGLIYGSLDNSGSQNENEATYNMLNITLTGAQGINILNSMTGGASGGDSYAITDGYALAIQMSTAKTSISPPQIIIEIVPYAQFFAFNAFATLEGWRQDPTGIYLNSPYNCILQTVYEDYSELQNGNMCLLQNSGQTIYSYLETASGWTVQGNNNLPLSWWSFANSFPTDGAGNTPQSSQMIGQWVTTFGNFCAADGGYALGCPFVISGTLSGLNSGLNVVLQNNGTDDLTLSANGPFNFATPIKTGNTYNVTVSAVPPGQTCTVVNGSGTVQYTEVTNIKVNCN